MNYHCVKEFPAEPDPASQDFRLISVQFRPKTALNSAGYKYILSHPSSVFRQN